MRSPEQVLKALNKHGKVSDYKFERLYRILFNEEMFHVAYQRIYAKPGNMTPGTDGKTINRMSLQRINKVIASLRDESYKPNPAKRIYIPKKNGKKRPLGIPSFEDKLVQEVVRMILEAVYEEVFANTSHGFRPNRSCHTALTHIQKTFTGTKWFVEGDIKGFFDNIDHNVLIATLRKRIADDRFLRLIRKLLNAGYIEDWKFHNTNKGTPQGGNISPILANIYLDNFDKYMEEYALRFNKGKERHITKEYKQLSDKMQRILKSIKNIQDADVRLQLRDEYEKLRRERQKIESRDSMDETYRRLRYVRYADDFLIGVIGSKAECVKIKSDITKYMEENLKLELSQEKTLITNAQKPAKFLGFDVSVRKSDAIKRDKNNVPARYYNGKIVLKVAIETVRNKLEEYSAIRYKVENGRQVWFAKFRGNLMKKKIEDIVAAYNSEIRGFYNYYCIANNVAYALSKFGYIMEYSMYHTIAGKTNSTVSKVIDKYKVGNDIIVPYQDAKGKLRYRKFYNEGFKRKPPMYYTEVNDLSYTIAMQVRFGGRYGKTYCRKAVRRSVPSLRLARSGDIIDLGILIYRTNDISRVLKLIENATPGVPVKARTFLPSSEERNETLRNIQIGTLTSVALKSYLASRGIDMEIGIRECREIHYTCRGRAYFAIGFPNIAGGYEMRSPYYKGCIAPKDISVTNTTKTTLACCLFEGFMDFLSYLTLVKQGKLLPPCRQPDLIVLNSVNNLSKTLSRLKAYKKIYCFLDNDDAGRKAVDLLREMNTATVYNMMEAFSYYKDVNDLLRDKKRMP